MTVHSIRMRSDEKEFKTVMTQGEKIMQKELSKQSTQSDIVISDKLRFGVFNLKPEKDNTSDTTKTKNEAILAMDKEYKDN